MKKEIQHFSSELQSRGFTLRDYPYLRSDEFMAAADREYDRTRPGENAVNKLYRGIGWAIMAQDELIHLERNTYQLSKEFNPQESGGVRSFVPLSKEFMFRPELRRLYNSYFLEHFQYEDLKSHAFELQLSAIRYEPSLIEPAWPSPLIPHQDEVDGMIVCLNKKGPIIGGTTRVYTLNNEPLGQINLDTGEALLIRDAAVKHQVSPVMLEPDQHWSPGTRAYRDVLLVRIQRLGR